MRTIDADELMVEISLIDLEERKHNGFNACVECIEQAPTVQSCEDAISRQEVLNGIEELKKSPWATDKRGFGFEYLIKEALDVVADLCVKQAPSVNPQKNIVNNGTMNIIL